MIKLLKELLRWRIRRFMWGNPWTFRYGFYILPDKKWIEEQKPSEDRGIKSCASRCYRRQRRHA